MPVRIDPPALPDWERAFETVKGEAQRLNLPTVAVGGYVRDRLLGDERAKRIPEVDFVVVDLPPRWSKGSGAAHLATAVGQALKVPNAPVIFERFGTAHLSIDPDHALEFVSSRAEKYGPTSRKPEVSPGSLKDDVMRRDFTVNTLLM